MGEEPSSELVQPQRELNQRLAQVIVVGEDRAKVDRRKWDLEVVALGSISFPLVGGRPKENHMSTRSDRGEKF